MNLSVVLHEEGRSGTGGRKARAVRRVLVVAQVAFAFILLIGSGLLLASLRNLLRVDPGFKSEGVITAGIGIPGIRYPTNNDARQFTNRVVQAIRAVPGIVKAGGTTIIPLGGNHSDGVIIAEDYERKPGESLISPMQVTITPGYFEAMSTPLVRGRYFDERDTDGAPAVLIIDERLAQRFWPGKDPIGKRMYKPNSPDDLLKPGPNTRWMTIVGVVRNIFQLVMREGFWLVVNGLVLGLAGTIALRRVLQTQIYGLDALDPMVLVSVFIVLGAIAVVASSLPGPPRNQSGSGNGSKPTAVKRALPGLYVVVPCAGSFSTEERGIGAIFTMSIQTFSDFLMIKEIRRYSE